MTKPWENGGEIIEVGGVPVDCDDCPCEGHATACETGMVADVIPISLTFRTAVLDFDLTWSATAVGGISEGWRYAGADLELCDGYLYVREVVFACNAGVWSGSFTIVEGGSQVDLHTGGGNMSDFALVHTSGPRVWESHTTTVGEYCPTSFPGVNDNLIFDIATLP